jgi:DNA-binding MarR family transcriptional regulator
MRNSSVEEDYELWVLLAQSRAAMHKARQKELTKYNISPRQSAVLYILQKLSNEASTVDIAHYLFREHHTVSALLKRMGNDGLVKRAKKPGEKGRFKISLTEKGQRAHKQAMRRESIQEVMSCLSPEERPQLRSSLQKIRDKALKLATLRELPFP